MSRLEIGLDLTESEFDAINARVTQAFKADGIDGDEYATKTAKTAIGYWLRIAPNFEKYFTKEELDTAVEYVPIIEEEEETIEL